MKTRFMENYCMSKIFASLFLINFIFSAVLGFAEKLSRKYEFPLPLYIFPDINMLHQIQFITI